MATRHVIISDFEKWCHRHSESKKLFGKGRIRFDIAIGGLKVWRNCQHHSGRIVNQGEIAALIQLCLGHPTACADIGSCWALCLEALPLKAIKICGILWYFAIGDKCCHICPQRAIKDYLSMFATSSHSLNFRLRYLSAAGGSCRCMSLQRMSLQFSDIKIWQHHFWVLQVEQVHICRGRKSCSKLTRVALCVDTHCMSWFWSSNLTDAADAVQIPRPRWKRAGWKGFWLPARWATCAKHFGPKSWTACRTWCRRTWIVLNLFAYQSHLRSVATKNFAMRRVFEKGFVESYNKLYT